MIITISEEKLRHVADALGEDYAEITQAWQTFCAKRGHVLQIIPAAPAPRTDLLTPLRVAGAKRKKPKFWLVGSDEEHERLNGRGGALASRQDVAGAGLPDERPIVNPRRRPLFERIARSYAGFRQSGLGRAASLLGALKVAQT